MGVVLGGATILFWWQGSYSSPLLCCQHYSALAENLNYAGVAVGVVLGGATILFWWQGSYTSPLLC